MASQVVLFLREILESHPPLRESVIGKLLSSFPVIHSSRVARVALWLVGEYCVEAAEVAKAFSTLQACLGSASLSSETAEEEETPQPQQQARPLVLPDGSYATQSAMETVAPAAPDMPKLRGVLLGGDYFLATVVGATLTKLALRSRQLLPPATSNLVTADVMLRLVALLQLGSDGPEGSRHIDADSRERISAFLHLLSKPQARAHFSAPHLGDVRAHPGELHPSSGRCVRHVPRRLPRRLRIHACRAARRHS